MKRVHLPKKKSSFAEGLISTKRFTQMDNPSYVYVFVRQDLSNEQQLVQAAHATLVLGNKLKNKDDVQELYFTVIGIPQLIDFRRVMNDLNIHGTKFECFYEPDQGNTLTAIATYPIPKDERGILKEYKLLRFNGK